MKIHVLIGALVLQGLSGVAGGFGLIRDPSGAALGIPRAWLDGSPFDSYLVPGLVLFTLLGILPVVSAFGVWRRRRWGMWGASGIGLALIAWILVQISVVGYQSRPPLQLVYGALGLVIAALGLSASTRRAV